MDARKTSLFKGCKLFDSNNDPIMIPFSDYYQLFSVIGWVDKIKTGITLSDYENNPMTVINKYSNYFEHHCQQLIKFSGDHKMVDVAKHLSKWLKLIPHRLPELMNKVTLEYCKQKYIKKYEDIMVEYIIHDLQCLVKSNHSLITSNDIHSCQAKIRVYKDVFSFINKYTSKNTNKLKENAIIFVDFVYPKKKIDYLQLIDIIKSLESISVNKLNRFFCYAEHRKIKERIIRMIFELQMVRAVDTNKLRYALKSIARVSQIRTYQWIAPPPVRYSDVLLMKQVREMPFFSDKLFFGYQTGTWKGIDLVPYLYDGIAPTVRPTREMALAINEKYLYELRCLGGEELFLEHANGDKIHGMYFDAENAIKKIIISLDILYKVGEWTQKNSEQRVRIYKMLDQPDNRINALVSMGILVMITINKLFDELIATLDMTDSEKIDLIIALLNGEFENQKAEYFILYPSLSSAKLKPNESNNKEAMTAVICGGTSVWFGIYKGIISRLLMNGMNVMTFSYRGYELSDGIPTDHKILQDLEIVCHYLREAKMIVNKKILLYASCMGLMPSSRYVENHPKTHLFIDRSFAGIDTLMTYFIQEVNVFKLPIKLRKLAANTANTVIPYLADFENLSHLQNAKGRIAVITPEKDELLETEAKLLKTGLPLAHHISSPSFFGHAGNWLRDSGMIVKVEQYLDEVGFSRGRRI